MPFIEDTPASTVDTQLESQVSKIVSIISAYRHRSVNVPDRFAKFVPQLVKQVADTVSKKEPLRFILPAFPFKAPAENNSSKTLGTLPDKAEEIALQTLDAFADSIADIYEGGASVVIVSDASVYGGKHIVASPRIGTVANSHFVDLLEVPDADAFAYQEELQKFASSLGLKHLEFVRPGKLAGIAPQSASTLEEYSAQIQQTRGLLDCAFSEEVDPNGDENVQATSKHYDTALPKDKESEAFKAAMLRRGKVRSPHYVLVAYN